MVKHLMLQLKDVERHVTTGQWFGRVKKNTSGNVTDTSTHTDVRAAPVLPTLGGCRPD